jgi:hypothetical protein
MTARTESRRKRRRGYVGEEGWEAAAATSPSEAGDDISEFFLYAHRRVLPFYGSFGRSVYFYECLLIVYSAASQRPTYPPIST